MFMLVCRLEKARSQVPDASTFGDLTMGGDGNTTGIKIVTFGSNPSTLSMEARVKELCAENEKLRNRITQLEERSMVNPNDTVIAQGNKSSSHYDFFVLQYNVIANERRFLIFHFLCISS